MRIKAILVFLILVYSTDSFSQNLMGLLPVEERDSIYILFNAHNNRYSITDMGTLDGKGAFNYNIFLEFSIDLRFTTGYKDP